MNINLKIKKMKKVSAFSLSIVLVAFSYMMLSFNAETDYETILINDNIEFPEEVQSILENKCMTCHSTEAKNFKSKSKINFDKFTNGGYSNSKIEKKLEKMAKELTENEMPPEKYLKKHPEKKLTKEESDLLIGWAKEQKGMLANK